MLVYQRKKESASCAGRHVYNTLKSRTEDPPKGDQLDVPKQGIFNEQFLFKYIYTKFNMGADLMTGHKYEVLEADLIKCSEQVQRLQSGFAGEFRQWRHANRMSS